jgi:general secretion pathway protein C
MAPRLGAALSWLLVAASLGFWGWWVFRPQPQRTVVAPATIAADADLAPLLGAPPSAAGAVVPDSPALASRIRLLGVVAPRDAAAAKAHGGVALLAVDGKPPRPYRVGARLDTELMLQAVGHRTAMIATVNGEPRLRLELPLATTPVGAAAPPSVPRAPAPLPKLSRPGINAVLEDAELQLPQPGDPVAPPPPPGPDPQQQAISGNSQ